MSPPFVNSSCKWAWLKWKRDFLGGGGGVGGWGFVGGSYSSPNGDNNLPIKKKKSSCNVNFALTYSLSHIIRN